MSLGTGECLWVLAGAGVAVVRSLGGRSAWQEARVVLGCLHGLWTPSILGGCHEYCIYMHAYLMAVLYSLMATAAPLLDRQAGLCAAGSGQ